MKIKVKEGDKFKNIFIGTFYVSPHTFNVTEDFFKTFNDEIRVFREKGQVFVQGDLNARTANESDFIKYDKYDKMLTNYDNQIRRNFQDHKKNMRGVELLDICKINDLMILNGRTTGDLFGSFTSHQWNGSSVVDYALTSNAYMENVLSFRVGPYLPWLSDHCSLHTTIRINNSWSINRTNDSKLMKLSPGFVWDKNSKNSFSDSLRSPPSQQNIRSLMEQNRLSTIDLANEIKKIMFENAKNCNLRINKNSNETIKNPSPWFDYECKKAKIELLRTAKVLKRTPREQEVRNKVMYQKKTLKKLCTNKKRNYKKNIINKINETPAGNNPKLFWNFVKKLSPKPKNNSNSVPSDDFSSFFKKLLNTTRKQDVPPDEKIVGNLDFEISVAELSKATSILKAGKSVGFDNISNEMLSCVVKTNPELILKLFNDILKSGKTIPDWMIGMIVPIHKKGDKSQASNYRGITLLSCLGKLFLTILNNRLTKFVGDKGILSSSQLGFIKGNRTSDAHIILNNIIEEHCHMKKKRVFGCFIDFAKAFDSVPRDILLKKLLKYGINGNLFNIIKSLYVGDKACIKIGNSITGTFKINQGVRQGCILSPLLFNIFIADLAWEFEGWRDNIKIGSSTLGGLFWADDILALSDSEVGLKEKLKFLENYCVENCIQINTDKTKIMIFNKGGRIIRSSFTLNGVRLENVNRYKYLGFIVTPSGEINTGLKDLKDRALKAFMKLRNDMGTSFHQDIVTTIKLIDSTVLPVILFNSDFWGCMDLKKNNPIETVTMMMYKSILGVHKTTTNVGVLLELGKVPANIIAIRNSLKNWERI